MSINQFCLLDILTSETLNAKKAELLRAGSMSYLPLYSQDQAQSLTQSRCSQRFVNCARTVLGSGNTALPPPVPSPPACAHDHSVK